MQYNLIYISAKEREVFLYYAVKSIVHPFSTVPPRHLLVSSSWEGGRVVQGRLGPYPEGADVTLSCQVTGGEFAGRYESQVLHRFVHIRNT